MARYENAARSRVLNSLSVLTKSALQVTNWVQSNLRNYFSDQNKKKSYRSFNNIDKKINLYSKDLPVLENDTKNIIEYVEQSNQKKRKNLISGNY